ncbi:MAG: LysR family transcriptional regulator [Candidatus Latescibacterota bacterium]|nr:LysR family transcriptional regulator [Candidatus Latescibacterota bacterium]
MNLHHLRYFLAVSRTSSFTQAAQQLHVTQPTVSGGVAELERELGVRLFHREGRRVELTMEGRTLSSYALRIEDLVDEAQDRVSAGGPVAGDSFGFGAIDAAVIYLLPDSLGRYTDQHPDVQLSIQVAPSRYLADDLLANRSEFAVLSLPYEHPRLDTLPVLRDEMPLVVGAHHPFAGKRSVRLDQVAEETLILFHPDSVSRKIVDEHFGEAGLSPRVVMEMRSPEAMRKLVEAGVGVSFLPRIAVAESLASGAVKRVKVRGVTFERDIGLAWRKGRYFAPAVRMLIEDFLASFDLVDTWRQRVDSVSN